MVRVLWGPQVTARPSWTHGQSSREPTQERRARLWRHDRSIWALKVGVEWRLLDGTRELWDSDHWDTDLFPG